MGPVANISQHGGKEKTFAEGIEVSVTNWVHRGCGLIVKVGNIPTGLKNIEDGGSIRFERSNKDRFSIWLLTRNQILILTEYDIYKGPRAPSAVDFGSCIISLQLLVNQFL